LVEQRFDLTYNSISPINKRMKVCIAEKPSVAKEIATILGAKIRKDGFFEGNGYRVTWTFGHLCTLKAPDDYTPLWKKWNLATLPMVPEKFDIKMIPNKGVSKQFKVIKNLVHDCTEVINCGDAGIEGELIQRWVLKKAECKTPVKRLWISSLTEEAIKEGFNNLKDASDYDLLYAAGNARAISDWILGMNASRLYTLKYANGKGVLSIGRVQTPTLALIVQRHHEIENFKPEKYWELKTNYRSVLFSATSGRFKTTESVQEILDKIKDHDFTITSFSKKKGKEQPPLLFDLTSLQVECNKKFSFTADNTLKTIQKLYEKKLVTYPRVDTRVLPSDMYPKISGILKKLTSYNSIVEPLLQKTISKSKRIFDDSKVTDHHAIIPTGVTANNLSPQEMKIYDTITRRFIAAFYDDCIVSNTTVLGEVENEKFKAKGKQILEDGWRVVYQKEDKEQKDKDGNEESDAQLIPEFIEGEKGPHEPKIAEKETKPPKHYTEGTLLRAMETAGKQVDDETLRDIMKENGIGRPSTRANIIETLFKRNYIIRNKKAILATLTGIQLIGAIENELLKSVELTGIWENKLRQIERGEYKAGQFLNEMATMITNLVSEVKQEHGKNIIIEKQQKNKYTKKKNAKSKIAPSKKAVKKSENVKAPESSKKTVDVSGLNCPLCKKGNVIKGRAAYGCSNFKEGCSFRVNFKIEEKVLTDKQIYDLISKGKTGIINGFIENGTKVKGKIVFDEKSMPLLVSQLENKQTEKTAIKSQSPENNICPQCGKGIIIKGKNAYGCNQFKEGCTFRIPFNE